MKALAPEPIPVRYIYRGHGIQGRTGQSCTSIPNKQGHFQTKIRFEDGFESVVPRFTLRQVREVQSDAQSRASP